MTAMLDALLLIFRVLGFLLMLHAGLHLFVNFYGAPGPLHNVPRILRRGLQPAFLVSSPVLHLLLAILPDADDPNCSVSSQVLAWIPQLGGRHPVVDLLVVPAAALLARRSPRLDIWRSVPLSPGLLRPYVFLFSSESFDSITRAFSRSSFDSSRFHSNRPSALLSVSCCWTSSS